MVVLAVTAVLSLTTPPSDIADATSTRSAGNRAQTPEQKAGEVTLKLNAGRTAKVLIAPARTDGSQVTVTVLDADQKPAPVSRMKLHVSLPARGIDNIVIPMAGAHHLWGGNYTFPYPGTWKVTLTVEDRTLTAVVVAGTVTISR